MSSKACRVLMIYPRFNPGSFWNYRATCELIGSKHPAPPLGLITVAAMLPPTWEVRLVDRNTAEDTDADYDWADMVMTGGMLPQQLDALEVIEKARKAHTPVVVGGPDATSSPHMYKSSDFRVLGEVEDIIPDFVAAWDAGERSGTFEAAKFQVDVSQTPIPRYDLLNLKDYFHINVQFSRGCPFQCEFCDIIELYGRVPRTKQPDQVLTELDRLYDMGHRGFVDFVDDNLIGNKKALKVFLPKLIQWQKDHGDPFMFSTEASLNLADDDELLGMLREALFVVLFIGIESPDPDVLAATQKKQNTRRDIAESVRRIYDEGIFVVGGFIVGFDEEPGSVAGPVLQLLDDAGIAVAMVGLLYALPNTQLTNRLIREGRLFEGHDDSKGSADQCTAGINFDTQRPRVDILRDYLEIIEEAYKPENYMKRVRETGLALKVRGRAARMRPGHMRVDLRLFSNLAWNITLNRPDMRREFWKTLTFIILRNPNAGVQVGMMLALYAHLGPFAQNVAGLIKEQIRQIESGEWQAPERVGLSALKPLASQQKSLSKKAAAMSHKAMAQAAE